LVIALKLELGIRSRDEDDLKNNPLNPIVGRDVDAV
jgi:hypothetical protein